MSENLVHIPADAVVLEGDLVVPEGASSIVLFAHGSGSGRLSPRNNYVAKVLNSAGIGTLLMDLLTEREDRVYERRFDIGLLTERLLAAIHWLGANPGSSALAVGLFGASTGAAAALRATAALGEKIGAVVSRGGRPDLAQKVLDQVRAPTLLIVGGHDSGVLELNERAYARLGSVKKLEIVPGATHLFEEPGALEQVARLAADWFAQYLGQVPRA